MEKLGINLGLLIIQILAFIIVFMTLTAWVYKPFMDMLAKRRKAIAQGLEDARVAAEARAGAEKEAQHILALAQQDASKKLREGAENAEKATQDARGAAEKEIAAMRAAAMADAEAERNRMLSDLRGEVAALAIAAAQKIVADALDEKRQRALIDEFFSGVKSGKVVLLDEAGALPASRDAEVVSALPLTQSEQSAITSQLQAKVGTGAGVSFRVDPSILGGLKLRVGDRIIDGTVAGKIEGLRRTLR